MKRSWLSWHIDRVFGNNKKIGWQIVIIGVPILILIFVIGIVGVWVEKMSICDFNDTAIQSIGLAFGASNLPPNEDPPIFPLWWQVIAYLFGAVFFSGVTITFVGNWLGNRREAFRNGTVRYYFSNHILFLGGSMMIIPMIKKLWEEENVRKLHFVILSDIETTKLRLYLESALSKEIKEDLKITVLRGVRDDEETLKSVHVDKAARIYVIGENPMDSEHDSTNMACWNLTKDLCTKRNNVPCFLLFNRVSSAVIFRHREREKDSCLDTTIVNRLETVAQSVLVHNGNEGSNEDFPALDRNGIDKDSRRTVHFVLYGMTPFSYAMVTTAAHLCHFPNFVKRNSDGSFGENKERRTKITMIAPNIHEEMAYFTSHLSSLFSISKCDVYDSHWHPGDDPKPWDNKKTMEEVGDFLDIEWDFVDGNIADEKIRRLLKDFYQKNKAGETYLTLAMCLREADKNIAAALYLPNEFHDVKYLDKAKTQVDFENTIPIYVFQPFSEELLETARLKTSMYKNIIPFGSVKESYDPAFRIRISEGKRLNYLFSRGKDDASITTDQTILDGLWQDSSYVSQMSSIYSASHVGVKMRSMGGREQLTDEEIQLLAITEHNRWNVEKLLMGFEALPKTDRAKQYDSKGLEELEELKKQFKYYRIEPYCELISRDRANDMRIVKNMKDIVKRQ